jgi:hypothetical protein
MLALESSRTPCLQADRWIKAKPMMSIRAIVCLSFEQWWEFCRRAVESYAVKLTKSHAGFTRLGISLCRNSVKRLARNGKYSLLGKAR